MIYLFVLHFIADFLLQSREMGQNKSEDTYWLACHLIIQMLVFAFGLMFVIGADRACAFAAINTVIHGVIDWNIWKLYKFSVKRRIDVGHLQSTIEIKGLVLHEYKYWEDSWFYHTIGLDQMLHMITLVVVWQYV